MMFSSFRFHSPMAFSAREYSHHRKARRNGVQLLALCLIGSAMTFNIRASRAAAVNDTAKATKPVTRTAPSASYVLGPDDVLEITLANHPQLNQTVTVRPDGKITFPRAGDVQAAGRTPVALAAQMKKLLERSLNNVRIQVTVKTARLRLARVIGAIKTPNSYPMNANWRVVDLIAAGGGLTTRPSRVNGRVVRKGRIVPLDVSLAMAQPNSAANFTLLPDDLLILDESGVPYQVTVSGEVAKPGPYDLEDGLTLTKLLARAGGASDAAALKGAQVLRAGVPIDLDISPDALQNPASAAARFILQAGDVLIVPENQTRYGVLGQVLRPAYYPLPEDRDKATLLKLLANSGGPLPDADLSKATVTHLVNGRPQITTVNLSAILQGKVPDTQTLQPDDVLNIPRKITTVVHVLGLAKPGDYALTDDTNVMSLISQAGSPTASSGLSKAYVLRDGTQIPLDLYGVLVEGKSDPQVSQFQLRSGDVLVVPDVSSQITVSGEVAKPGSYNLGDRLTVPSLLAEAGNVTSNAALSQAYVLRNGARVPLDLNTFLVSGVTNTQAENFQFQAGDVLVVPENQVRYAVLGQVARPGNFAYPETAGGVTVLEALTEAGGPLLGRGDGSANLKGAGIVRIVNGERKVLPVDIGALLQKGAQGNNVKLQPKDILYIPPSKRGFKIGDLFAPLIGIGSLLR